jgi:2-iminobutanoate/2-iminopropanoate deaminase
VIVKGKIIGVKVKKKEILIGNASAAHILSEANEANGFVFVSGQIHMTQEGVLIEDSVEVKLAQIMKNITSILDAASLSLDDVVKVTIYVTDMSQMAELNKHYPTYFEKPYPAREAVCVKELPLGATIEISVIVAKE